MSWANKNGQNIWRGESVFTDPLVLFLDEEQRRELLPKFYKQIKDSKDERTLGIFTSLVLENYVDDLLLAFMPGYSKKVFDLRKKLLIMSALKLLPMQIIDCAQLIRQVRNDFAHELGIDGFDGLPAERIEQIKQLCSRIYGSEHLENKTNYELFWNISFLAITGFSVYYSSAKVLRDRIDDPNFIKQIQSEAQRSHDNKIREIMQKPPIEIEQQGDLTVKRYPHGIVGIE